MTDTLIKSRLRTKIGNRRYNRVQCDTNLLRDALNEIERLEKQLADKSGRLATIEAVAGRESEMA